jgi:hypothetical protein
VHLETTDVPLHGAGPPGQDHAGFDRLIVIAKPFSKALEGYEGTLKIYVLEVMRTTSPKLAK